VSTPRLPELLLPLVTKGVLGPGEEQVLTFWHETIIVVLPDGARLVMTYRPRERYVYVVFGITMGTPRDYDTGDELITDDYGFWHRHSQMRWHWNPGVESIHRSGEPLFLVLTQEDPMELEFYNNSGRTVIQDITIWLWECSEQRWELVRRYLRGLLDLLLGRGGRTA